MLSTRFLTEIKSRKSLKSLNKIVMKYQDHHAQFTATGSQLSRQKLVAEIEAAGSKGHWVDVVVRTRSQPSCTAAYTRGTLRAVVAGTSKTCPCKTMICTEIIKSFTLYF